MCNRCMGVNFGRIDLVRFGVKNSESQFRLVGCWNLFGVLLRGNDCRKISVPMLTDEGSLINLCNILAFPRQGRL